MESLFSNILTASFHGSFVILAVIILRVLLRKAPRKFICFLWLLAGLRLLMPFEIQSSLSLQPMPEVRQQWQASSDPAPRETLPEPLVQSQEPAQAPEATVVTPEEPTPEEPEHSGPARNWLGVIPYVWLGVAACFGLYMICAYLSLKNKVREAVKIQGGWECDRIETAFILGFIRPQIYIPMGLSAEVRKHILAHERTHLEKGDHWFKMIGFLALALHWFNPLAWAAYILLCRDIELACDERVVQFMDLEERKSYSAALLSCSTTHLHFAACPVAFGEVSVKKRIKTVLDYRRPSFWVSLLAVAAVLFVAVCLLTNPTSTPDAGPTQTEEESEAQLTAKRISDGLDAIISADQYSLIFADTTDKGSVGWQLQFFKDGENTLWWSTDNLTKEGYMVLNQQNYTYLDRNNGMWVPTDTADTTQELLESLLAAFSFADKELFNIKSEKMTNDNGTSSEKMTFTSQSTGEDGQQIAQPVTVYFGENGNLGTIRISNSGRKAGDVFNFSPFFAEIQETFENASQRIVSAEEAGPIAEQTEDERLMKQWGIDFRVEDDCLTSSGSQVMFAQAQGYDDVIRTDEYYWIEKQADSGWEVLPTLTDDISWRDANYVLSHEMYTAIATQWSDLYGALPGGMYRLGKIFQNVTAGKSCTGYAEFRIFENPASTEEQKAAVERCYAALEELKNRKSLHWLSISGQESTMEEWLDGENFLRIRHWELPNPEYASEYDPLLPRTDTSVQYHGVYYSDVREDPEVLVSKVLGQGVRSLSTSMDWNRFADDFNISFMERGNFATSFPEGVGIISDEVVRFVRSWDYTGLEGAAEGTAQLTYRFDENGKLVYMEYLSTDDELPLRCSIEIYPDTAEEIEAKISSYAENPYVSSFSWEDARAKYETDAFNHRSGEFVNTDAVSITNPVDAARRALLEYPRLKDYLDLEVSHDDGAGMWRVTVRSYHESRSSEEFRDIYLDDNGVTHLLVYEGPIEYGESRR